MTSNPSPFECARAQGHPVTARTYQGSLLPIDVTQLSGFTATVAATTTPRADWVIYIPGQGFALV